MFAANKMEWDAPSNARFASRVLVKLASTFVVPDEHVPASPFRLVLALARVLFATRELAHGMT